MSGPLLSVVIPVHNRPELLRRAVASVLANPEPMEVIVVDDGSTDESADVAASFGEPVRVIRQSSAGPGSARNRGIDVARAPYVAFLDSDDLWFPWTARLYRQVIDTCDRPSFIAGRPLVFHEESELAGVGESPVDMLRFADYYASGDRWRWFSASSMVIRTDVLRAVGGMTDRWVNAEDWDLTMRLGVAPGFVQVTNPATFAYRQHAGSAMANWQKSYDGWAMQMDTERAGGYPGGAGRARHRRRLLTLQSRPLSLSLLQHGRGDLAWAAYRRTFTANVALGRWKYLLGFPLRAMRRRRA